MPPSAAAPLLPLGLSAEAVRLLETADKLGADLVLEVGQREAMARSELDVLLQSQQACAQQLGWPQPPAPPARPTSCPAWEALRARVEPGVVHAYSLPELGQQIDALSLQRQMLQVGGCRGRKKLSFLPDDQQWLIPHARASAAFSHLPRPVPVFLLLCCGGVFGVWRQAEVKAAGRELSVMLHAVMSLGSVKARLHAATEAEAVFLGMEPAQLLAQVAPPAPYQVGRASRRPLPHPCCLAS